MEGAFTHLGNHLVSDSASTINAGDDDESILNGRGNFPRSRRRGQDEAEELDVFDGEDAESAASLPADGANCIQSLKKDEAVELPPHACA